MGFEKMKKRLATFIFYVVSAGSVFAAEPVKVVPPQQKTLASENGRFVFGQISDARRDQFMLDTKTGRLWQIVVVRPKNADGTTKTGDGYPVLQQVPYTDDNGRETPEPKQ